MSSLLTNLPIVQNLAKELIKAKNLNYSQQCVPYYIPESKFIIDDITDLITPAGHKLKSTLIKHRTNTFNRRPQSMKTEKSNRHNNTSNLQFRHSNNYFKTSNEENSPAKSLKVNKKCILFLHGLGSSRLEPLPIIQSLPKQYCLFTFDSAGSGKSQGNNITYGMRQSDDIGYILEYLIKNKGLKQFIIWGRSMGAVAGLLFIQKISKIKNQKYQQKDLTYEVMEEIQKPSLLNNVKGMVIDSPFCDFIEITKQIALKRVKLPEFLIQATLSFINQNFNEMLKDQKSGKSYNPFQIKLSESPIQTSIPAVFVYSEVDEVVPKEHSLQIIKNFKGTFQKISIQNCTHNQARPKEVLQQIFQVLQKFQRRYQSINNRSSQQLSRNRLFENRFDLSIHQRRKSRGISLMASSQKSPMKSVKNHGSRRINQSSQVKNKPINTSKLQSYNSLKIQPNTKKLKKTPMKINRMNNLPESINNFIDKFKTINHSVEDSNTKQEKQKKKIMFHTIQTDSNDIIQKKLHGDFLDKYRDQSTWNKPIFRGRRNGRVNRKVQYQLNHTRYL